MACLITITVSKPTRKEAIFLNSGDTFSTRAIKISTDENQTSITLKTRLVYSDVSTGNAASGQVNQAKFSLDHNTKEGFFRTKNGKHISVLHLKQDALDSISKSTEIL